ncbi:MAG: hypothetical protein R2706_03185 [Acidimicrobiales bacterium]
MAVGDPLVAALNRPGDRDTDDTDDDLAATPSADLSLSVTTPPTLAVGERGDLTIVLSNFGPADAGSAAIAYVLPQGVALAAAGPNGCHESDGIVTCAFDGPLASGESAW